MKLATTKRERATSIAAFCGCLMSSSLVMLIGSSVFPLVLHFIFWLAFFALPIYIYRQFSKTDAFIAYHARQAVIMQGIALILVIPLIIIVAIAGDNAYAFAERLNFVESIVIVLYVILQTIVFYIFVLFGSFYGCYRVACGHEARYLPVMIFDKVLHENPYYSSRERDLDTKTV